MNKNDVPTIHKKLPNHVPAAFVVFTAESVVSVDGMILLRKGTLRKRERTEDILYMCEYVLCLIIGTLVDPCVVVDDEACLCLYVACDKLLCSSARTLTELSSLNFT